MIPNIKRWWHSHKARRIFEVFIGLIGFLLNGLCVFVFSTVFWYDSGHGQPHFFLVIFFLIGVLPVALATAIFGVYLNRKNILSWTGLILGGLIILFFLLTGIYVEFVSL